MANEPKPVPALTLAPIAALVLALYALVAVGVDSPLWRSLVRGEPVGLEASLDDAEREQALRLDAAFARMGYGLDKVAQGAAVPPVFLPSVPADLAEILEVDAKKRVFLRVMLPLVLVVNEGIAADRKRLEQMAAGKAPRDEDWLAELAERYRTDADPRKLLARVDLVPPSLALAQAAEESGWGTSRFVREANNLFGQVGGDVTPEGDPDGPRMAAFSSLHEAVRAYVDNLNAHPAYETFRRARAAGRAKGHLPDGHSLAGALVSYSERGHAYVDTIRAIIRANTLLRFDRAKLGGRGVVS